MRLWSLHPKYLDAQGLVALWREALLAQAVLNEETKGYKNHPQLERFQSSAAPLTAIAVYLQGVYTEAVYRGYTFNAAKIRLWGESFGLTVTSGQIEYERTHLMQKLQVRNPSLYAKWQKEEKWEVHPMFTVEKGGVEKWERVQSSM